MDEEYGGNPPELLRQLVKLSQAKIVNVMHFQSKQHEPVLLHFTSKQWAQAIEGVKPITDVKGVSTDFEAVPMPGQKGAGSVKDFV